MIHLINCGYNYIHQDGITIDRPNGSGNYAFVFFKSKSEVVLNGDSITVDKNSFILLRPATTHLYRELEMPFVNDWFHCDGDDIGEFLAQLNFPLDSPIRAPDPFLISRYIIDLHNIHRQSGPLCEAIIDSDLRSLFMKLCHLRERTAFPEKKTRYFLSFSELRNELYHSPSTHFSVEQLASRMNLSKSFFQHTYKELFGCSVVTDMIHSRLEYAKYLLDNSSLSVAVISRMCGYDNDTHFMRQFKKFVGATPSQYKSRKPA
jgi:AraC family transcriptional regulator, arabinose operon regulatory protein